MFAAHSLLFVPGSRADLFVKAKEAGAFLTVIDLEDAVPPEGKAAARSAALEQMGADSSGWAIRINPVSTLEGLRDICAIAEADAKPPILLVPMAESVTELDIIASSIRESCPDLIPLIETPRGLRNSLMIAGHEKTVAVMFGGGDFAAELGVELSWEPLLGARQNLLFACAEAGVPAIDVPYVKIHDAQGLADECARAKAIGFAGKAAIHPVQVATIESVFEPSHAEYEQARSALAAFDAAGGRPIRHDGRMLEKPLVRYLRTIVASKKGTVDA